MEKLNKLFKYLVWLLSAVLYFSYWPLMHFGSDSSMNFELSVPLIWLVVFDLLVFLMMIKKKMLFQNFRKWWVWLLFPVWLTLSVLWSLNFVRGVLTVGVLWLIYFAVYGIWQFKELFDVEFWRVFWRWFFGASLVVCVWCVVQCVLDLVGVSREYTLMCAGCTYASFGFPHPNGFSIEPQFMGNLLLAPTLVIIYFILKDDYNSILRRRGRSGPSTLSGRPRPKGRSSRAERPSVLGRNLRKLLRILLLVVLSFTLFLTFSRGAIYAFIVGLVVMSGWELISGRKKWQKILKRIGIIWGVVILSFGVCLNVQGLMAEFSPTNDTYKTGMAKVLNHLSLGVIDISGSSPVEDKVVEVETEGANREELVENPVENFEKDFGEGSDEEAWFDGYVAESTDTRLRLSGAAIKVWSGDLATAMFGVGLGGAGQALYVNNLSPAPKEIVQNQYTSLLLETGVVGVSLLILTMVLAVKTVGKSKNKILVISLIISYMVTLCFFSGLPNALHIYLLPTVLAFPCVGGRVYKTKKY